MVGSLWIIQLVTSSIMTGLIWLVQLVHYPSFRYVDPVKAHDFHAYHTARISVIVMPVMIIELASSAALAYYVDLQGWIICGLTILIWLSTFALQVPLHNKLAHNWDQGLIDKLVNTNWMRTILWSVKTGLLSYWMYTIL